MADPAVDPSALLDAVEHDPSGARSEAQALEAAVRDGTPLGPLATRLRDACRRSTQVPVLAPLASALMLDGLRRRDEALLNDLTARAHFRHGFLRALEAAAQATDLPAARLALAATRSDPDFARIKVGSWLRDHPDQIEPLARAFAQDAELAPLLPAQLNSLGSWRRHPPLTPALPWLLPQLAPHAPSRAAACRVLQHMVAGDESVEPALPALRRLLQDPEPAVRLAAAQPLVAHNPAEATELARSDDPQLRRSVLLSDNATAEHLALGLLDPEPENAQLAFRTLERREHPTCDQAALAALCARPDCSVARYLRVLAERDPAVCSLIVAHLPQGPLRTALAEGQPWCRICAPLPQRQSWRSKKRIPATAAELEPAPDWEGTGVPGRSPAGGVGRTELGSSRCPVCGWRYRIARETDVRGLYDETEYLLERLPPTDRAYPQAERGPLVARLERELDHIEPDGRVRAAWGLTHQRRGDPTGLRALLLHNQPAVREHSLRTLRAEDLEPTRLLPTVRGLLSDPEAPVRAAAGRLLAPLEPLALLGQEDPGLLRPALAALLDQPDQIVAQAPRLRALLAHPDRVVARGARRALAEALRRGGRLEMAPLLTLLDGPQAGHALPIIEQGLRHGGPEPAWRAALAQALAPHRPRLVALLAERATGNAVVTLIGPLSAHLDVRGLVAGLAPWIAQDQWLAAIQAALSHALAGPTPDALVLDTWGTMLASRWAGTAATRLLELARRRSIAAALPAVRRGLASDAAWERSQCARILVCQALRDGDEAALEALRAHPMQDVRSAVKAEEAQGR